MITLQRTLELLDRAVAEKGADYSYKPRSEEGKEDENIAFCRYVEKDGQPGCIVGVVLSYADLLDGIDSDTEGIADTIPNVTENFYAEAALLLANTQALQDQGIAWGEAVLAAKNELRG